MAGEGGGRARSGAISMQRAIVMSDAEVAMLEQARTDGIMRGVTMIGAMVADAEAIGWQAIGSAASLTASNASYGVEAKAEHADDSGNIVSNSLEKLLGKCMGAVGDKLSKNKWVQRLAKIIEMGIGQLIGFLKRLLLNKGLLKEIIPFYGPIRSMVDGAWGMVDAAISHAKSLTLLDQAQPQIGSGIPTVALEAFGSYVRRSRIVAMGKSGYTLAKGLASLLIQIFTMGASSLFDLITSIVEAVVQFTMTVIQAIMFSKATGKCRAWVETGAIDPDFDFATVCAGCPVLGSLFFGAANYIGHFNLTAMLSDGNRVISSAGLTKAVSTVSEVQREACGYVNDISLPIKFRTTEEQSKFGWLFDQSKGMANDDPKTWILSSNATTKTKFRHYRKRAWHGFKKGAKMLWDVTG